VSASSSGIASSSNIDQNLHSKQATEISKNSHGNKYNMHHNSNNNEEKKFTP